MKYHYQYVSNTSVRIELIPEDQKEKKFMESLTGTLPAQNYDLENYFNEGLLAYQPGSKLKKTSFMQYPKVALCRFETIQQPLLQRQI